MKKFVISLVVILLLSNLAAIDFTPNEVIIKTSSPHVKERNRLGIDALDNYLSGQSVIDINALESGRDSRYFVISFDSDEEAREILELNFPGVEYIERNYLSEFFLYPNDPLVYGQYFELINIPQAWQITTGRKEILVAVVDSGTHYDHPDLQENIYINQGEIPAGLCQLMDTNGDGRISNPEIRSYFLEAEFDLDNNGVINHKDVVHEESILMNGIDDDGNGYIDDIWGWDFTDASELANIASGDYLQQDNDPEDEYNHGTHVAGVIGATANNGTGISGICWDVSMLSIRAGFKTADGLSGVLQDDDAAAGIIYAADMGADVINLSWGDNVYASIIADACEYAYNKGCIIVVSAGNTASLGIMYPARLSHTISVGAVDELGERFWQSSYGPYLDIVAPGVNVLSCFEAEETLYESMSGTSMSAPYISGAVALMLSRDPDLSFEEIRARLAETAIDQGAIGRDDLYGYGILDANAFLQQEDSAVIEVLYPTDNLGISESISITGSITDADLSRYSVMYAMTPDPEDQDWLSVEYPHVNQPYWYYDQVVNEEIAWFEIPPVDGECIVKIEAVTIQNEHYQYNFSLHLDQSTPELSIEDTAMQKRYAGENLINYLRLKYNEPVDLVVDMYDPNGESFTLFSSLMDSLHYLALPLLQAPGIYSAHIQATNVSGLIAEDDILDSFPVNRFCINYSDWQYQTAGNAQVCIPRAFDYEADGIENDLISMELDEDLQRSFYIWEDNGYGLEEKNQIFGFSDNFWLHSIGNINYHSFEIVGVEANTAAVYTVNGNQATQSWSLDNSYGGSFIDYDGDGIDDLALIQNVTIGNVTYRVMGLSKKLGSSWNTMQLVYNETATNSKNEFLNKVVCADYDGDGKPEIVTADNDGDVIVYEQPDGGDSFTQVWTIRMPAANADYLLSGNFRSSSEEDFCVGTWNYDSKSSANTFSCFAFFSCAGDDNYQLDDLLFFDEYQENNAITSSDLDGDGDEEIILALDPNLYIVDYIDTDNDGFADSYSPIWKGVSQQDYANTLGAIPGQSGQRGRIIANALSEGNLKSHYIQPQADFSGPPSVEGFQAQVIDEQSVKLSWLANTDSEIYQIFRKRTYQNDSQEIMISQINSIEYIDSSADSESSWDYRIRAFNSAYDPDTSLPSFWETVTPAPAPELTAPVKMCSPWNLELHFDQALDNSVSNTGYYHVNHDIGRPASVNLINQKKGILLTYHQPFPQQQDYEITIFSLVSESGIILSETRYPFAWAEDTEAPRVISSTVISSHEVKLLFNEPLDENSTDNLANYQLTLPKVDTDNSIRTVSTDSDQIILSFDQELKASNQCYYIKIRDVRDLAGNLINNHGCQAYFTLTDITLENMIAYPNPFDTGKYTEFRFAALPVGIKGELWIYDLTGVLVFYTGFAPRTVLENYYSWDGKNNSGNRISSGLYFYIMQIGDDKQRGKIAVVN